MSVDSALCVIKYYTNGTWRLNMLTGNHVAHVRQQVLESLTGQEWAKKDSGITTLRGKLFAEFNCTGSEAEKQKQFAERAEAKLKELQ